MQHAPWTRPADREHTSFFVCERDLSRVFHRWRRRRRRRRQEKWGWGWKTEEGRGEERGTHSLTGTSKPTWPPVRKTATHSVHKLTSGYRRAPAHPILLFRSNKVSVSRWNSIAAARARARSSSHPFDPVAPLIPRLLSITLHDSLPGGNSKKRIFILLFSSRNRFEISLRIVPLSGYQPRDRSIPMEMDGESLTATSQRSRGSSHRSSCLRLFFFFSFY